MKTGTIYEFIEYFTANHEEKNEMNEYDVQG